MLGISPLLLSCKLLVSIHCRLSGDRELQPALISWLTTRVGHTRPDWRQGLLSCWSRTSRITLALTGSITGTAESGKGGGNADFQRLKAPSTELCHLSLVWQSDIASLSGWQDIKAARGELCKCRQWDWVDRMALVMHVKPLCDLSVGMWQAVIPTTSRFIHHLLLLIPVMLRVMLLSLDLHGWKQRASNRTEHF